MTVEQACSTSRRRSRDAAPKHPRLISILEDRKLTQTAAAKILGIAQPKVSNIYRGNLDEFSIERLTRLLNRLHRDVRIVVESKARRRRGRMIVEAA